MTGRPSRPAAVRPRSRLRIICRSNPLHPTPPWPGPESRALFAEEQGYIAPGIQSIALLSQLTIEKGEGCRLTDADGRQYLDFNAGVSVASLGYSHPAYVRALQKQLEQISVGSFTTRVRIHLLRQLAEMAPAGLTRTQLFSSGAEAVESALRLARSITGKKHFIGFRGGYHGKTAGTLPLSLVDWKTVMQPFAPVYHESPYADCYRCPLKLTYPACGIACAEELRTTIKTAAVGDVAAVIAEPIQGTAGNIVPPDGFLQAIREITREAGAMFIADEMITGFGRTGYAFGVDHDRVIPDILTIGKGMGSGFPVSGVMTTDSHAQAKPWSNPSASSSSYGGNPLACAAADVTIQTIRKNDLIGNSRRIGAQLLNGLRDLQNKYRCIGDVRGRGLLIGLDLVENRETKEPLAKVRCEQFFMECLKRGLIAMSYSPRVRLHPPLILTDAQAQEALSIMDEAFAVISA